MDRFTWRKESGEFYCKHSTEFRLESEGWAEMVGKVPAAAEVHEEAGTRQQ